MPMIRRKFPEPISSDLANEFKDKYADLLDHEITRKRIQTVVQEYVSTVDFMQTVRRYAGYEIDNRLFTNAKHWGIVIGTSILTTLIALLLGQLFRS
jgi:hypothetical protein